jgi:hypothetical protein
MMMFKFIAMLSNGRAFSLLLCVRRACLYIVVDSTELPHSAVQCACLPVPGASVMTCVCQEVNQLCIGKSSPDVAIASGKFPGFDHHLVRNQASQLRSHTRPLLVCFLRPREMSSGIMHPGKELPERRYLPKAVFTPSDM